MTPLFPRSTRDHFVEPPSILERLIAGLPSGLAAQMQRLWDRQSYNPVATNSWRPPKSLRQIQGNWNLRRLLSLPHIFVVLWVLLLLWGERWVFQRSIEDCEWGKWERWVRQLGRSEDCKY